MQVHIETEINASASVVWQILAHQFADIANWTSTLSESRLIGLDEIPARLTAAPNAPVPARETTSSFIKAFEVINAYSEEEMELTFEAANLPAMLSTAANTQRVVPVGDNRCLITFDMNIGLNGIYKILTPILKRRFHKTMSGVQQELKMYAENRHVAILA